MSTQDGEKANALNFNGSYVSREVQDNKAAQFTLDDPDTGTHGTAITSVQKEQNSIASFIGKAVNTARNALPTWASDAIGVANDFVQARVEAIQVQVEANLASLATKVDKIVSVDNTLPRFDDVGGDLQGSGIIVDDSDNVTIPGNLTVQGTTTTIDTETLDVEDANITVNKGGDQATADAQDAGITVEMSDATDAQVGYDSTFASKFKVGEIGSEQEIASVGHTQQLTNKDIDGGTASNTNRITLPKESTANLDALTDKEGTIMYDTDLSKPVYNDGVNNIPIGEGGTASILNYIKNPSYESNIDDVLVTANISKAIETTNKIRGAQSLALTIDSSATVADNVDFEMDDVDPIDLTGVLNLSFSYATDANYTTDDVQLVLRNIDSGTDIEIDTDDANKGKLGATGGETSYRTITGTAQLVDPDNTYALRLKVLVAPASNSKINVDAVKLGPQGLAPGAIVTPTEDFIPVFTGFGTVTNIDVSFSRDGDKYYVQGRFTAGTSTAVEAQMTLPKSGSVRGAGDIRVVGKVTLGAGVSSDYAILATGGDNFVNFGLQNSGGSFGLIPKLGNQIAGSGTVISFFYTVPIEGLTAGAIFSTTEANFLGVKTTGQLSTATHTNDTNFQDVSFTEDKDLFLAFDGTTFTAPRSAFYNLSANIQWVSNATGRRGIRFLLTNADLSSLEGDLIQAGGTGVVGTTVAGTVFIQKGGTAIVQGFQSSGGNLNYSSGQMSIIEQVNPKTFSVFGKNEFLSADSSPKDTTGLSGDWLLMTGSEVDLTPGIWILNGFLNFQNSGAAPAYSRIRAKWCDANGSDNSSEPASIDNSPTATLQAGMSTVAAEGLQFDQDNLGVSNVKVPMGVIRVLITETTTVFLVPNGSLGTPANGRVETHIYAERIG